MAPTLPTGTVTLLFTDIEGSTRLLRALGDDYGDLLSEHRRVLRETWIEHGGVEVDTEGDAFFVAFARPDRAVAAATAAQRRLAGHDWPGGQAVRVRIGVHTGTPTRRDDGYWGEDVHYAARLAGAAHGGQVLLSTSTQSLVADLPVEALGEHAVKDFGTPRQIFHLVIDGVPAAAFPPPRTAGRARSNLPPRTNELVGRAGELVELVERVAAEPLVTITGPGGVGKTRLLIELGHELVDRFERVAFVSAEQLTSAAGVLAATVRTLGLVEEQHVDDLDRLLAQLTTRQVLLLIDNLEQVPDAAAALWQLATAGPGVRVVTSSQLPLRVAGEHVLRLGPLPAPMGDARCAADALTNPAVDLLVRRAEAIGSTFTLNDTNAADVIRLCAALDGMPLALELAAARLDLLTPVALTERVERGLDALGRGGRDLPPRQRGLRAVLEWTCGLLEPAERSLLAELSIFADGFTLDLAEAAFGDCLDEVAVLVEVSLLHRTPAGRLMARPPVRRFADELLRDGGAREAAWRALCEALIAMARPYAKTWFVHPGIAGRRSALNAETDNVIAALDWAAEHDAHRHARLAAATGWWMAHGENLTEFGTRHLRLALDRVDDAVLRADCLHALGFLAFAAADGSAGLTAAAAWRELGDALGEVMALGYAANMCAHADNPERSLEIVEAADEVLRAHRPADANLRWFIDLMRAQAMNGLGHHTVADATARRYLGRFAPGSWHEAFTATILADIALADGRYADSLPLYAIALDVFGNNGGSRVGALIQADTIMVALARLGRTEDAATALGICELCHDQMAWPPRGLIAGDFELARSLLRQDQIETGRARARALGLEAGLAWVGRTAAGA